MKNILLFITTCIIYSQPFLLYIAIENMIENEIRYRETNRYVEKNETVKRGNYFLSPKKIMGSKSELIKGYFRFFTNIRTNLYLPRIAEIGKVYRREYMKKIDR